MIELLLGKAPPREDTNVAPAVPDRLGIGLLGGFRVTIDGATVAGLPSGSQRLLVFLALQDRDISRIAVAGIMWPEVTAQRAGDSLRSALARLDRLTRAGLTLASAELGLDDAVRIDYREARALARRLLDPDLPSLDADLAATVVDTLSRDLLPDWPDEWILAEGDEWRHLRASALEALAMRLLRARRHPEAEGAARAAIRVDPLRETPHGALIRIHLSGGNQSDALGAFDRYRSLLGTALGIEPTHALHELVLPIQRNEFSRR